MAQVVRNTLDPIMDVFNQNIVSSVPGLDPNLAMKIIRLNRELLYRPPHVHLNIEYKEGTDLQHKVDVGRDNYPIQIAKSRWDDGVIMTGMMDVELVQQICSDDDIVRITGDANAAMY